jgi:hypothetical protein
MKWVLHHTGHAVEIQDGERTLTFCGIELIGKPPEAELDEFVFPPNPCQRCVKVIGEAAMVPETPDQILERGFTVFDPAQSE